ncbi:MAG TPA: plastocyanin/azurin family copper-binding protein [Myxococcales bacterium]|jgi:plastocyanin
MKRAGKVFFNQPPNAPALHSEMLMRHTALFLGIALTCCGRAGSVQPAETGTSASVTVVIGRGAMNLGAAAFGTNPLSIAAGTRVTWVNQDDMPHTATADDELWDSGLLQPGESFSFTFTGGGTFGYHCAIHGKGFMSGAVAVAGAANQGSIPSPQALTPTFKTVRDKILNPHCMACHVPPAPSGGLDFTTWDSLVHNPVLPNLIVPGSPGQSRLFLHMVAAATSGGQEATTTEERKTVSDWIQAGAPND